MKITNDGFIWKEISYNTAVVLFHTNELPIYQLRDDVDALIESIDDLNECFERDIPICLSVGKIDNQTCKNILQNNGLFTDNLWCVDDVKCVVKCDDDDECIEILNDALTEDYTYTTIWDAIKRCGVENGFELNN